MRFFFISLYCAVAPSNQPMLVDAKSVGAYFFMWCAFSELGWVTLCHADWNFALLRKGGMHALRGEA